MLDDRRLVLRVHQRAAVVARRRRPDVPRRGGRGDETDAAGDEAGEKSAEDGHGNACPWVGAPMASPAREKTDGIGMGVAPGDRSSAAEGLAAEAPAKGSAVGSSAPALAW